MKQGLEYFTDTYLTSAGLIIFFLFFAGVLWWTSRRSNKAVYQHAEHIPFEKGELS